MRRKLCLDEVYTIEDKRDGSWATWLANHGEGNTYVLSLLCSRENSEVESYKEVARVKFLSDDSAEVVIFHEVVPHRIEATKYLPQVLLASGIRVRGYEVGAGSLPEEFTLLPATRCKRCARILTRPISIRSGLGDECAGRKPRAGSKYAKAKTFKSPEEMREAIRKREEERKRKTGAARLNEVANLAGRVKLDKATGRYVM